MCPTSSATPVAVIARATSSQIIAGNLIINVYSTPRFAAQRPMPNAQCPTKEGNALFAGAAGAHARTAAINLNRIAFPLQALDLGQAQSCVLRWRLGEDAPLLQVRRPGPHSGRRSQ